MRNHSGEEDYFDIGKKARDVLHKDYSQQLQAPFHFDYRSLRSNIEVSCKVKDIVPGLNTIFSFFMPNSGKVEVEYLNGGSGILGGLGLIRNDALRRFDPIAELSGVLGRGALFSFRSDLALDMSTGKFNQFNAGLNWNNAFAIASLSIDRFDTLKASCYYLVDPLAKTAIAAELKHSLSINHTGVAIGAQHAFSPSTLAKGKISTQGKIGALIQQALWDKIYLSISGELDFTDTKPNATPKIGMSLAVKI